MCGFVFYTYMLLMVYWCCLLITFATSFDLDNYQVGQNFGAELDL